MSSKCQSRPSTSSESFSGPICLTPKSTPLQSDKIALHYKKSDPQVRDTVLSSLETLLQRELNGREETEEASEHIAGTVNNNPGTLTRNTPLENCEENLFCR